MEEWVQVRKSHFRRLSCLPKGNSARRELSCLFFFVRRERFCSIALTSLHLVHRVATDSQNFRSFRLVSVYQGQDSQQVALLQGLQGHQLLAAQFGHWRWHPQNLGEIGEIDDVADGHNAASTNHVLQFAYISRPRMSG